MKSNLKYKYSIFLLCIGFLFHSLNVNAMDISSKDLDAQPLPLPLHWYELECEKLRLQLQLLSTRSKVVAEEKLQNAERIIHAAERNIQFLKDKVEKQRQEIHNLKSELSFYVRRRSV